MQEIVLMPDFAHENSAPLPLPARLLSVDCAGSIFVETQEEFHLTTRGRSDIIDPVVSEFTRDSMGL